MSSKTMKLSTLVYAGVGSVVGSGWLIGSAVCAQMSGPSAILSWLIGTVIIGFIAINLIELCSFLPAKTKVGVAGYIEFTHGSFPSFLCELMFLLSWIGMIPAEAAATVQYFSYLSPTVNQMIMATNGQFTTLGILATSAVCFCFFIINYLSLIALVRFIKYLTLFKIVVPIIVIVTLIAVTNSIDNLGFTSTTTQTLNGSGFFPYGFNGFLAAIIVGGVVFSFNGFQTPLTFANELENPRRDIPLAFIITLVLCASIYILLQLAYILAVPKELLIAKGGWSNLIMTAPFLQLSYIHNLPYLAKLLIVAAFLSPFGAGIIYYASTARIVSGFTDYLPRFTGYYKQSRPLGALLFVLAVCCIFLWLLPSWKLIVAVVCSGIVLLFAVLCVVNGCLNKVVGYELRRAHGICIKYSSLWARLGFISSTLMFLWAGWPLTWQTGVLVVLGVPIYAYYHLRVDGIAKTLVNLKSGTWILFYILSIIIVSKLSTFGGDGVLSSFLSQLIMVLISLVFYQIGVNKGILTQELGDFLNSLKPMEQGGDKLEDEALLETALK